MAGEAVKFEVKIDDRMGAWLTQKLGSAERGLEMMAQSIQNLALMKVPRRDGDLGDSCHIEKKGKQVAVIFGGGDIKYAAYQERGHRYDGSHQVRNYTTAGTGAHYLEESGKEVTAKGIKQWLLSAS